MTDLLTLNYGPQMNLGLAGDIYDNNPYSQRSCFNTLNVLPFGVLVAKVSGTDDIVDFLTSSNQPLGITRLDKQLFQGAYPLNSPVGVVTSGNVNVATEELCTEDSPVYVRVTGKAQVQTLVFSGNLITSNVISGNAVYTDNGGLVYTTPISVTFATNNAATLTALAAAIQATPGVLTATSNGTNTITVTMSVNGETVNLSSLVVTLGASQATIVITQTTNPIPNSAAGNFRADSDGSTAKLLNGAIYVQSSNQNLGAVAALQITGALTLS